jgi:hypothetical protein
VIREREVLLDMLDNQEQKVNKDHPVSMVRMGKKEREVIPVIPDIQE